MIIETVIEVVSSKNIFISFVSNLVNFSPYKLLDMSQKLNFRVKILVFKI